jgi:NTP pyrophosphatase (non-canonical NTP hydrolase)
VVWTPEYDRGVAAGGLESPGPLERHLKSFFYVAPAPEDWTEEQKESYLREYNDYMQQIFCIHEAMPGHYVNGWYSNQFPSLVRALLGSGTFVEGWALYSEKMMLDAGYTGPDPRLVLSRLKWNLRVIINTIIDVGLHTRTMTEQEALTLMIHGGFQEESEARNKIVRPRSRPCSLRPTSWAWRASGKSSGCTRKDEKKFDPKTFNERVLSFGNPPLDLLEEMVLPRNRKNETPNTKPRGAKPRKAKPRARALDDLFQVCKVLRGERGCPWDKSQTITSLTPYILEETHEVIDAIAADEHGKLKEEIGDLLFLLIFLIEIADEKGLFTPADVVGVCEEKMKRRHPHVFGRKSVKKTKDVLKQWEEIKLEEEPAQASLLRAVPTLPSLVASFRLQEKAPPSGSTGRGLRTS